MKFFKTQASCYAERIEINKYNYEHKTNRQFPYEQYNKTGGLSQYAVCPSCMNPIQLIGVYGEKKVPPYGRHTGQDIDGLPPWNLIKYKYCPFADRSIRVLPNDKDLLNIDDRVVELYQYLKEHFDQVIIYISSVLGIRGETNFWEKCLKQFIANHAYCYPWLTESNLPYIFAYSGIQHQNLYKLKFRVGTDLYNAIAEQPNTKFIDTHVKNFQIFDTNGKWLHLEFRFTDHKQQASSGEKLCETMMFYVDKIYDKRHGNERKRTVKTIYKEKIQFSETDFADMVKYNRGHQQWLLDVAEANMPLLTL